MPELLRDEVRLGYLDTGTGDPVVLVHGAASSHRSFARAVTVLAESARVVAPDLRGMGSSARVRHLDPTDWVDDLLVLLDRLGLDHIDLCGTSLGARVAARFALDHPDRVRTLILDAPMLHTSPEGDAMLEAVFGPGRSAETNQMLEHWHGSDWESVTQDYLRLRHTPGLQEYLSVGERLGELDVPVLITRGDIDDPIHPISHAVTFHERIRTSQLWVAPGIPFSVARFQTVEWAYTVLRFIKRATQER